MPAYRTAFISHAHADNARCASIAAHLKVRGIDRWIDLINLQKAHSLPDDITRELVARQTFVLMVTPHSDVSPWVSDELNKFLAYSMDPAMRLVDGQPRLILPVRLELVTVRPVTANVAWNSNWAKVLDRFWIDGVGKSDAQVADEIAAALKLDGPPPPPPNEWDEIAIASGLYRLGLRGWRVRATSVEFILPPTCDVAAGAFDMGSADSDKQAADDEKPQYRIPVGAFAIGKFPVTVAEYACYLKANPDVSVPYGWDDDFYSWEQQQTRPDHPVVRVTWFNAHDYAAWLAKTTGQPWRLPTEAEWEKAARWDEAEQLAHRYPWGDVWDPTRANTIDGGPKRTTPIGTYPSGISPCGAFDMAGNVWEWLSSRYQRPYPYDRARSEIPGDTTSARVLRGGSWNGSPRVARAACRAGVKPGDWTRRWGSRLARGVSAGDS